MLVSSAYDGMPWLERVYQAGSLWDALEMGAHGRRPLLHPRGVRAQAGLDARGATVVDGGLNLLAPVG